MKTYKIHAESWADARPVGTNPDGTTAMRFEDLRESELTIVGFRAALAEAKRQRKSIDDSGRFGSVTVFGEETGSFRVIGRTMPTCFQGVN